jgi:hypothetical protein
VLVFFVVVVGYARLLKIDSFTSKVAVLQRWAADGVAVNKWLTWHNSISNRQRLFGMCHS